MFIFAEHHNLKFVVHFGSGWVFTSVVISTANLPEIKYIYRDTTAKVTSGEGSPVKNTVHFSPMMRPLSTSLHRDVQQQTFNAPGQCDWNSGLATSLDDYFVPDGNEKKETINGPR